nr:uncharacterized protein LOC121120623 [Lepeophtheirus salmonis]
MDLFNDEILESPSQGRSRICSFEMYDLFRSNFLQFPHSGFGPICWRTHLKSFCAFVSSLMQALICAAVVKLYLDLRVTKDTRPNGLKGGSITSNSLQGVCSTSVSLGKHLGMLHGLEHKGEVYWMSIGSELKDIIEKICLLL